MTSYILILIAFVGLPLLVIWLAKRDRAREKQWGDQSSESSIVTGSEYDMPRILPAEPPRGLMANRAPIEELGHRADFRPEGSGD